MKLVVGYDGSDNARRALERASRLAAGDVVLVVSVVPLSAPGARGPAAVDAQQIEAHHKQLEEARKVLASHGADAQLIETLGNPIGDVADALMHVARVHDAELIVVGTRGLGMRKRLVVGSVSTKLVREAPCDVLVVR
jgi:nucleotide-binding universal stress UspA family protein